jgi:circadian clock protein KaiC
MASAGIDLARWVDRGLLVFHAARPNRHGLESHLLEMHHAVEVFDPSVVVVDPITNLLAVGSHTDVRSMLTRLIDFLKTRGVTAMFASLAGSEDDIEATGTMISSLMDTWILLATETTDHRRSRRLNVLKSRGMPHSDEVRNFQFTSHGIELEPTQGSPAAPATRRRHAAVAHSRAVARRGK